MINSTVNPYEAYVKVLNVITNEKNEEKHLDSINQLVRNYANKFPDETLLLNAIMRYKCELEENLLKENYE